MVSTIHYRIESSIKRLSQCVQNNVAYCKSVLVSHYKAKKFDNLDANFNILDCEKWAKTIHLEQNENNITLPQLYSDVLPRVNPAFESSKVENADAMLASTNNGKIGIDNKPILNIEKENSR